MDLTFAHHQSFSSFINPTLWGSPKANAGSMYKLVANFLSVVSLFPNKSPRKYTQTPRQIPPGWKAAAAHAATDAYRKKKNERSMIPKNAMSGSRRS